MRYLGETIRPASGESYDWHSHDFGQLISAASGSMQVGTPNRVLLLSAAMKSGFRPMSSTGCGTDRTMKCATSM